MERKIVAVSPPERLVTARTHLRLLETLFPVRFVPASQEPSTISGWLCWQADKAVVDQAVRSRVPSLVLTEPIGETAEQPIGTLSFPGTPSVQSYLRGHSFPVQLPTPTPTALPATLPEAWTIATIEGRPVWWESRNDEVVHRYTSLSPGGLSDGQPLFPGLLNGRWIGWLPLFHFLREVTADCDWVPNGSRACFMFDDPNLHWRTWGFLDYQRLVEHADKFNYHVSMATVPADMWFAHRPTADLFRRRGDRLSLLVHGVLHTHAELQRPMEESQRRRHLAWGLERVKAYESRHHVRVSRVMAPPHHACSSEAAQLMLEAGLEAGCVSWTALMRWNPHIQWKPEFGLGQAEFLGQGFPVIPRFNFADQDKARALIAHLFHQPIVMIGHHYDVAESLDVLADWSRWVAEFGGVEWTDLETMARSNCLTRRQGDTLFVRLGSRRVHLNIPEGVRQLVVERPWWTPELKERVKVIQPPSHVETWLSDSQHPEPIPIKSSELAEIHCAQPSIPLSGNPGNFSRIWPIARRLFCEARDRLQPIPRRLRGR
jgi:hypothetical protein